eukprot:XP_783743.2 PREDICTED: monocarboxylate transporter 12-like [Strongylocentrotus purpuratus]
MAQTQLKDSVDPWKYVIIFSKFLLVFVECGITKSFGVLIPDMVTRYESDYKTVGFVCGLPTTLMYFSAPVGGLLMKVVNPRIMAISGGILSAVSIICSPLAGSIYILGIMLALTGFGMSLTYFPIIVSLNIYCAKSFIFANTLTIFGSTCGAFLVPIIVERSLEAYGYTGAFLILGGICLHTLVCGAVVRPPKDMKKGEGSTSTSTAQHELMIQRADSTSRETWSDETSNFLPRMNDDTPRTQKKGVPSCNSNDTVNSPNGTRTLCESLTSRMKLFFLFKEPLYTLVMPAIVFFGYVNGAWMLFLVPHAEGAGIQLSRAVFLSSIAGISGIFGRILYLVLLHFKVDSTLIFCVSSVICATSFFIDSVSSSYTFLAVMASIQGFTMFHLDCIPHAMMKLSVRSEENLPQAIAVNPFLFGLGVIVGDFISGHLYDITLSFSFLFMTFGVVLVIITINLVIYKLIDRRRLRDG